MGVVRIYGRRAAHLHTPLCPLRRVLKLVVARGGVARAGGGTLGGAVWLGFRGW